MDLRACSSPFLERDKASTIWRLGRGIDLLSGGLATLLPGLVGENQLLGLAESAVVRLFGLDGRKQLIVGHLFAGAPVLFGRLAGAAPSLGHRLVAALLGDAVELDGLAHLDLDRPARRVAGLVVELHPHRLVAARALLLGLLGHGRQRSHQQTEKERESVENDDLDGGLHVLPPEDCENLQALCLSKTLEIKALDRHGDLYKELQ